VYIGRQDNLRPEAYEFHMLGMVCETVTRHSFLEWMPWWTPESEPESRSGSRRLTGCEGSDSFSGSSVEQTGLNENPKPLFSGSFLAENVCWGARRGASLASVRFFWEATPVGIHPKTHK
jgi:hypothetical protein